LSWIPCSALSQDGIPVVIHDRRLNRTTNGSGLVDQLTYQELVKLDAGLSFSESLRGGRIPRLKDVLERYYDDLIINIELKNMHSPYDRLVETVVALVEDLDLPQSIIYSSFLTANLKRVLRLSPGSKTALICSPGLAGKWLASFIFLSISKEFIHPFWQDISANSVRREHRGKRRVHAWTVNDSLVTQDLIYMGIEGIMTNDLSAIFSVLKP